MGTGSTCGRAIVLPPAPQPKPPVTVRQFLDSISADQLAEAALDYFGGLGGPTVGEAFLLALKKMAEDSGA